MVNPPKKKTPRGITQVGPRNYRARIMVDGAHHSLGYFQTISDARAALEIARADLARGVFIPPAERKAAARAANARAQLEQEQAGRTVAELAAAWLAWLKRRGRKQGTIYTYERRLHAHYLPEFGTRPVRSVTGPETRVWADTAPHDAVRNVAAMWAYAAGESKGLDARTFQPWCEDNPAIGLDLRTPARVTNRNEQIATPEQIAAIAEHMPEGERLAVLLSGWAGLRIGEVLALRRRHVHYNGSRWTVAVAEQVQARGSGVRIETPKTRAARRTIPVPPIVAPTLGAHLEGMDSADVDALLFPRHPGSPEPHHPNTVRQHFNRAVAAVNLATATANADREPGERVALLESFTWHGLRHSALTHLGHQGATLADLMAFAGHTDIEAVKVYQHATLDRLATLTAGMGDGAHESSRPGLTARDSGP